MKRCTKCGVEKDISQFHFMKTASRYMAQCIECTKAMHKRYREANKERLAEYNSNWQKANRERMYAAQERWKARNPGLAAQRTAEWRTRGNNRERALERARITNRQLKIAAYQAYGGLICQCCGETEEAFLSLDHVNNDGAMHRREVDRRKIYQWLAANGYPPGFQVLCMNCNFGKARNGGVCPHKKRTPDGSTTMA